MGIFDKLKNGLKKTSEAFSNKVDAVLKAFVKIDEDLFEELEEVLVTADIGIETSMEIIETLRDKVKEDKISEPSLIKNALANIIKDRVVFEEAAEERAEKTVVLVIGVNGVGKTTSVGKLANLYKTQGSKVLVAAADTFRAAAIEQLQVWTERANVPIIHHSEGSDPGAVVFDAISSMKSRGYDVLICDTAGRLHNKKNLMNELAKISKIINNELPEAKKEVLLVLDATTGQNALSQAKLFGEIADITGIVLTKLDGTAKGGIVVAMQNEQKIPVKFIGVGEQIDDLQKFSPTDFVNALLDM